MILKLTILVLAARTLMAPTVADIDFLRRVVALEMEWDRFYRRLAGCPDRGPADATTCKLETGRLDYTAFMRSRRAAAHLFDFRE